MKYGTRVCYLLNYFLVHDWDNNALSTSDYTGQENKELEWIWEEKTWHNFTQFHHFPGKTEENNEKNIRTAEIRTFNLLGFSIEFLLLPMIPRLQPLASSKCGSIRRTSLHCEQLHYDLLYTHYSVFLTVNRMHNFRVVLITPWIILLRWRHLLVQGVL